MATGGFGGNGGGGGSGSDAINAGVSPGTRVLESDWGGGGGGGGGGGTAARGSSSGPEFDDDAPAAPLVEPLERGILGPVQDPVTCIQKERFIVKEKNNPSQSAYLLMT